jgi:hypothetical protein
VKSIIEDLKATAKDYKGNTTQSTAGLTGLAGVPSTVFKRKFKPEITLDFITIPLLRKGSRVEVQWPVLSPCKVWQWLQKEGKLLDMMVDPEFQYREFWAAIREAPYGERLLSGLNASVIGTQNMLPIRLHGDDGEAFKDKSFTYFSWAGVRTNSKFERFLITVLPKAQHWVEGGLNHTLQGVGQYLLDQLTLLRAGSASSKRGVLVGLQGDLKFFTEFFSQARHTGCIQVCFLCAAERCSGALKYWHPGRNAPWRATSTFDPFEGEETPQPLYSLPGFGLYMLQPDLLHTLYLGVGEDVVGSCAMHVLRAHEDVTSMSLWEEHLAWLRQNSCVTRSTSSCFSFPFKKPLYRYPHVKTVKGWDNKLLILWFSTRKDLFDSNLGLWSAVFHLALFLKILDTSPIIMSDSQRDRACHALRVFCSVWCSLALDRILNGDGEACDYKVRPKYHMLLELELALQRCRINPRLYSTFGAESFVGECASITRSLDVRSACRGTLERFELRLRLHLFQQA